MVPIPPTDEQLMAMVRVYHGFATDAEVVDRVGYDLELMIEKMRQAWCAAFGVKENTH